MTAAPCRRTRPGPAARLLCVVLLSVLAGCADTVSPVLGGLRLGVRGGSFRMPVMQNERLPFDYPGRAYRERIGGQVRLRIHIAASGSVDSAYVLESSGHAVLDSAALAGARRLRYRPARQGERPVAVWAVLPVRYPLPEEVEQP
ncbi:MAG TPA: energy transducer TonB [Gemmatimonadota bacterium]|nr:energy transducer TonB [Gemmatimonadota bacterium]